MTSTFGNIFRVTTFGESHGHSVGVVIDGIPPGIPLDLAIIQRDLDRRRPGTSRFVSPRNESDRAEILSGLADGKTLGSPVAIVVRNTQARSKDYNDLRNVFRPGHADYTYFAKYGVSPQPGGGRSSGRETVGRVAAGAIARLLLARFGVSVRGYVKSLSTVEGTRIDLDFAETHPLRCADPEVALSMEKVVKTAQRDGDSVGGVVEIIIRGAPSGLGAPVFDKLDAILGAAFFSIGGVKGVEFGSGFSLSKMMGSQSNDPILPDGFASNHAGGILGGISTGQDIIARLAVKPTPSISKTQQTIDMDKRVRSISVRGRHDPCICPRIVPVAEAMAAIVIADAWLSQKTLVRPE
jgi:chorismate synthase